MGRQTPFAGRFPIEVQSEKGRGPDVPAGGIKHRLTNVVIFIMIQGGSASISAFFSKLNGIAMEKPLKYVLSRS